MATVVWPTLVQKKHLYTQTWKSGNSAYVPTQRNETLIHTDFYPVNIVEMHISPYLATLLPKLIQSQVPSHKIEIKS